MMKRMVKVVLMVALAIAVGAGTVYAVSYTAEYYIANGTVTQSTSTAELDTHNLDFTDSADYIRMRAGVDIIYMANGADELSMGPDSDKISFYAQNADEEEITFNSSETSYIKYTNSDTNIEIKSSSGDVIITLGN